MLYGPSVRDDLLRDEGVNSTGRDGAVIYFPPVAEKFRSETDDDIARVRLTEIHGFRPWDLWSSTRITS